MNKWYKACAAMLVIQTASASISAKEISSNQSATNQSQALEQSNITIESSEFGELWLPVEINNLSGKMLVDTGSSGSVFRQDKLSELKDYTVLEQAEGFGVGNSESKIESTIIQLNHFSVAGNTLNIKQISSHFFGHGSDEYLGLIGLDVIRELSEGILINSENLQLLTSVAGLESRLSVPLYQSEFGLLYFKAEINDKEVGLIVDSGSQYTVIDASSVDDLAITTRVLEGQFATDIEGNSIPVSITPELTLKVHGEAIFTSLLLSTSLSSVLSNDKFDFPVVGVIGLANLQQAKSLISFSSNSLHFLK